MPLIVTDPSGRFTRQIDKPRTQLASSVDLAPMLVSLGNRGSSRGAPGSGLRSTASVSTAGRTIEFYDYSTTTGRAETQSTPDDPRVQPLLNKLFGEYTSTQMEAPLPASLRSTVAKAKASYVIFKGLANAYAYSQLVPSQKLRTMLGYSGNF